MRFARFPRHFIWNISRKPVPGLRIIGLLFHSFFHSYFIFLLAGSSFLRSNTHSWKASTAQPSGDSTVRVVVGDGGGGGWGIVGGCGLEVLVSRSFASSQTISLS